MISTHVENLKTNYSVKVTSTTNPLTPLNPTLPIASIKLLTTSKLPPDGKEYLCFQINSKSSQAAKQNY